MAQDNDLQTWNAYRNQYWPAQYIVDQNGKIVFQHAGEGQYEQIDRTVARLLNAYELHDLFRATALVQSRIGRDKRKRLVRTQYP